LKKLKDLVKLMVDADLTEVDLQDQGERVTLKRGRGEQPQVAYVPAPPPAAAHAPAAAPAAPVAAAAPETPAAKPDEGLITISSPMVGTFYHAASPDAPPFVSVGTTISPESVVCIIEAMKVFNEIKAETRGTVVKVLVENGQAVEFNQPLFQVKAK
jgi:acetyl-CoA carboxylase biotin carboxyl carrier protein